MTTKQQLIYTDRPLLELPVSWPARRDYWRARRLARTLGLEDCQAVFLDKITVLKTQYDHRDLCILDILNRECSKGHALKRWAEERGIPRERVMAIGDNHNDLEMLEFAGVAVVMGNASHELKQSGWMVTGSNEESGVAQAVEEILGLAFSS